MHPNLLDAERRLGGQRLDEAPVPARPPRPGEHPDGSRDSPAPSGTTSADPRPRADHLGLAPLGDAADDLVELAQERLSGDVVDPAAPPSWPPRPAPRRGTRPRRRRAGRARPGPPRSPSPRPSCAGPSRAAGGRTRVPRAAVAAFSEASLDTWMETDACDEKTSSTRSSWSVKVRRSNRLRHDDPGDRALVDHGHHEGALRLDRHPRDGLEVGLLRDVDVALARSAERRLAEHPCPGAGGRRRPRRRTGSRTTTGTSSLVRRRGRSRRSPTGSAERGCRRSSRAWPGSPAASRCRAAPRGSCRAPRRAERCSSFARRACSSMCRLSIDAAACSAIIAASTCMLCTDAAYCS